MNDGTWNALAVLAERGFAAWTPGALTFVLAVAAGIIFALAWRWPFKPLRIALFDGLNALDRYLVEQGSWAVGTRMRAQGPRLVIVTLILFALGTLGAFLPDVFGFTALFFGLVAILIVYRHWSWDEDDVAAEIPEEEKRVPIAGNLRNEVLTAVAFLFFYYPIAFAKLQAEGFAFSLVPGSGLVALTAYTLLEFVKAIPFVDYYEIFGDDLRFDQIVAVGEPTMTGKSLTLALRASFDLVLVAAVMRLPEIAKLAQEGRDLRPIDAALAGDDEDKHLQAVDAAAGFALRRRARARERLMQVTERRLSSDRFRYAAHVRLHAADQLVKLGARFDDDGAFMAAAAVYRQAFDDPHAAMSGFFRARRKRDYGNMMATLARSRSDTLYLHEALAAYHDALTVFSRDIMLEEWASVQVNRGIALNTLANRTGDAKTRQLALDALRDAEQGFDREKFPIEWARVQLNLGNALCDAGRHDPTLQREGIAALEAALAVRTRELDAQGFARTQHNLGVALYDYWHSTQADDAYAERAIAAYEAALTVRKERDGREWADSQERLGTVLSRLGRKRKDLDLLARAVTSYRASLKQRRRDAVPLDWAQTQNNIGLTLLAQGEFKSDVRPVREAIEAFGLALEERTKARGALDWGRTTLRLADAHARIAAITGERDAGVRATALYDDVIPVLETEDPEAAAEAKAARDKLAGSA